MIWRNTLSFFEAPEAVKEHGSFVPQAMLFLENI
jgi:hypothetical protein